MEEDAQYLSPGEEHRARDNLLANQISLPCQRCLTHLHVISLHEREGREREEREGREREGRERGERERKERERGEREGRERKERGKRGGGGGGGEEVRTMIPQTLLALEPWEYGPTE